MDLRDQLQSTLGDAYTLERELGGGGMSRVFVADETRLGRKVVVKLLSPDLAQGLSAERFEREIKLAASLQQANVVPVLSVGESNGLPYYTMPYVEGESLRHRLASAGTFSVGQAVSVLRDVARALAYAHSRGIVHRDIKPDNVLLSGGAAVVTDFGIAKAIAASRGSENGNDLTLTQLGTSIGTPAYISPEQAAGDPDVDHRADIYSFGCMAYELLVGHPPFHNRTPQRVMAAHMGEAPQPITELRPDVPPALAALIMRCLEKNPAARPQTANEMFPALENTAASDPGAPALPAILVGGRGMFRKALAAYAAAFIVVAVLAKAAIVGIGLPDWVFPGALVVMALGLPVILLTGYVQYVTRRAMNTSPTYTPGGTPSLVHGTMATVALKASPHLSWRRTTRWGMYALGAFVLLIGAFMTMRALGIGPAGSLFASGALKADDKLVLTDFTVKGGDSTLSGALTEAVRTELGQSNIISVLNPTSIADALRRMRKPAASRIDVPLAREIAQREGAKAVVDGDITPVGAGFLLSIRLVTADSGVELASFHESADGLKDLLPTLDELVRDLRGKMGESLRKVQSEPPLEQYTTASLDALRKLAEGRHANNIEGDYLKSAHLMEEAVALDSTFAMAWRALGVAYANMGYARAKIDSAYAKAYRYRDRLTDHERLLVESTYFTGPGHDRAKTISTYETLIERYPHDYAIYTDLALEYESRRQFAHAESLYKRSIAENPASIIPRMDLMRNFANQGRVREADSALKTVLAQYPNAPTVQLIPPYLTLVRGQDDSAWAQLQALRTSKVAQVRVRADNGLAAIAMTHGRIAEFEQYRAQAVAENASRGGSSSPIAGALDTAFARAWVLEQGAAAASTLDAALAKRPMRTIPEDTRDYFGVARIYAYARRPDRARAMLAAYDADVRDTLVRREDEWQRHWTLGEIAIAEGRPRDAIVEFRKADVAPDGPAHDCAACTYAMLGRAFDLANMPDSSIAMFEKYLDTPYWDHTMRALDPQNRAGAYKRLGELYEAKGDRQKAASYDARFVDLWKNADPALQPKVAEVRKRLARLADSERR